MSKARKGVKLSPSHCKNLSIANTGENNPRYHKPWSPGQYEKWLKTVIEQGTFSGENNPNYKHDLDRNAIAVYRYEVHKLSKRNWIQAHGKYKSGRVEGGFELDHKVPVTICFQRKIPIEICAHLQNLQLLPWQENAKKHTLYAEADLALLENLTASLLIDK